MGVSQVHHVYIPHKLTAYKIHESGSIRKSFNVVFMIFEDCNPTSPQEGWQWREFSQDSPVRDAAPSTPTRTPLPPISRTTSPAPDAPDNDTQSVEIVRVVPHRLIEIPASGEPFEPRPPPRLRPSSGRTSIGSGVFRRARRLLS